MVNACHFYGSKRLNITIAAIGKLKSGIELDLYQHYSARLKWKITQKQFEIKKPLTSEQRKLQEAEFLLSACADADCIIALDEKGELLSSPELANYLRKTMDKGAGNIAFIIGGADGLHDNIRKKANLVISFGRITYPHLLVRGLLVEQLYRSFTIMNNHPYHRE